MKHNGKFPFLLEHLFHCCSSSGATCCDFSSDVNLLSPVAFTGMEIQPKQSSRITLMFLTVSRDVLGR